MYEILLTSQAERDLKRLVAQEFHRIIPAIKALANTPRPPGCRKLVGSRQVPVLENVLLVRPAQRGEHLWSVLLCFGVAGKEERNCEEALQLLRFVGLEAQVSDLAGELSYGQQKLLTLACCLATGAKILLLDEPLSNLDARIREEVRHEIKALQAKLGITTIHVTHDREEAMVMADRIAILDAGRIAQLGTPEEVYNRPNSPFVASFMGAANVLELDARATDGGMRIVPGPHHEGVFIPGTAKDGPVVAYFRSEAATLGPADAAAPDRLLLRGRIVQASYPGGFYRYAVAVGQNQFMVDDARRLPVGEAVGIGLPVTSLHFFSRREA
jgi:putative spermidine/putrescine transport system ATP-binding protein